MHHDYPLITTMAVGLVLACIFALGAHRLRLPLIAGYLAAGVVIGPFTPGFVADQEIATQLAEMGVILLMFGVGLHFSISDLLSVRRIAVPGALVQMSVATAAGTALALALGWGLGAGLIFGLSLSVASTVVLLRALQDRDAIETPTGRIAVGWLVVEDLAMVLALVLIPALAGPLGGEQAPVAADTAAVASMGIGTTGAVLLLTGVKLAAFLIVMLTLGSRVIPWFLDKTASTGQRELFRLSVLAIAIGTAWASSTIFDVSFALGAFFAGMLMAGSPLSAQALKDVLPFRDAFAVLFFVSVGMLFNPAVLWEDPLPVLATVAIIIGVKSFAAYAIVRMFGHDRHTGAVIAASLAQIGEFSFILIVLGVDLAIVPPEARDLVVAGALVSIVLNPLVFATLDRLYPPEPGPSPSRDGPAPARH
jgi:CPA2 family monovalent cation:H+ antiporter-2